MSSFSVNAVSNEFQRERNVGDVFTFFVKDNHGVEEWLKEG